MNLAAIGLAETRPVVHAALLVTGALAFGLLVYGLRGLGAALRLTWRHSLRLSGWLPPVLTALVVGVVLLLPGSERGMEPFAKARLIETVIPLALAIQACFLLTPDDEPVLELLLTCPRPASLLLLERLLVVALAQMLIGLIGALAVVALGVEDNLPLALLRWIPPALLLTGLALNAAIRSRRAAFGVMAVGLIWFVVSFFHQAFLPGVPTFTPLNYLQPWLWPVHLYLQPGELPAGDYLSNRLMVLALGINLIALAVYYLRDSERLLLGKSALKRRV